jgi:transcriptional regulator with XRE-family HTH domain
LDEGLNQEEFAQAVGVEPSLIGRHETLNDPPSRNRRALASMIQLRFGVDADWILNGDELPAQRGGKVTGDYRASRSATILQFRPRAKPAIEYAAIAPVIHLADHRQEVAA